MGHFCGSWFAPGGTEQSDTKVVQRVLATIHQALEVQLRPASVSPCLPLIQPYPSIPCSGMNERKGSAQRCHKKRCQKSKAWVVKNDKRFMRFGCTFVNCSRLRFTLTTGVQIEFANPSQACSTAGAHLHHHPLIPGWLAPSHRERDYL